MWKSGRLHNEGESECIREYFSHWEGGGVGGGDKECIPSDPPTINFRDFCENELTAAAAGCCRPTQAHIRQEKRGNTTTLISLFRIRDILARIRPRGSVPLDPDLVFS